MAMGSQFGDHSSVYMSHDEGGCYDDDNYSNDKSTPVIMMCALLELR